MFAESGNPYVSSLQFPWGFCFFFNFIIYLSVLAAPSLHLCVRAFSSCTEWGLLSLWCTGSVIALLGLSCPEMCESSQTWGRNQIPALAGRFLTTGPPQNLHTYFYVVCLIVSIFCCSVAKSCLTPCDPMDCSTPGFPALHYLPEFAHTRVHWVDGAIYFYHLSTPSPPALNLL